MPMKSYFLWGAALGASLAVASCGVTDVEPDGSGGLGGEAGAASGGASASGGGSAAGGVASGGRAAGGAPSGGLGGLGGSGAAGGADNRIMGTLGELEAMDCVVELDEGDDGSIDGRWGVDYVEGQVTKKLIWTPDDTVIVVAYDGQQWPSLVCWPDGCDRVSEPEEPASFGIDCPEGSAPTGGNEEILVERYENPPDEKVAAGAGSYTTANVWLTTNGLPTRARFLGSAFDRQCFFPDGTVSYAGHAAYGEYDGDEEGVTVTFFPNQQLAAWRAWAESDELLYEYETGCNAAGWQLFRNEWPGGSSEDHWSTTDYVSGGGLGGASGDADLTAHTLIEHYEAASDEDFEENVASVINESVDGLGFDVAASSDRGWSEEFSLDRSRVRSHVVGRVIDAEGHLVSEGIDETLDDVADSENSYSYSAGCLEDENPQLDFVPRTTPAAVVFDNSCPFNPLPPGPWDR